MRRVTCQSRQLFEMSGKMSKLVLKKDEQAVASKIGGCER